MRASTVFAIALSLLIALGAAAGAKYAGLFDKKAPPPPPEKAAPIKVLVATVNLYEDMTVMSNQVRVRDIYPDEQRALEERYGASWQSKLMPPLVSAGHLRVAKFNIDADRVLLREYFFDSSLPPGLPERLEKNTRAVNVSVTKDKSAGGAIRVGDYVDVFLTTKVWDNSKEREEIRTACIAHGCKVVMKRNTPWSVVIADPDDKPLHFTLQANLYRAALIDYAQSHGQISLQPVPKPEKTGTGSFSIPTSKEYANEDQRIEDIASGELSIGDKDLVRIFQLPPPSPKPLPPQPHFIEHYSGVSLTGKTVVYPSLVGGNQAQPPATPTTPATGGDNQPKSGGVQPAGGMSAAPGYDPSANYTFGAPSATGSSEKKCASCEEKKKKQNQSYVVGR